jgi:hypothetical protein
VAKLGGRSTAVRRKGADPLLSLHPTCALDILPLTVARGRGAGSGAYLRAPHTWEAFWARDLDLIVFGG